MPLRGTCRVPVSAALYRMNTKLRSVVHRWRVRFAVSEVLQLRPVAAARSQCGVRMTWRASPGGGATSLRSCCCWFCLGFAVLRSWQKMEVSALVHGIRSASRASLASGGAAVSGLGKQLGAWGTECSAGYNSSLNPDSATRYRLARR